MKTTNSLYDVAEHLQTPEIWRPIWKPHRGGLMVDAASLQSSGDSHLPGDDPGGTSSGPFQGDSLTKACLVSAALKL